MKHKLHTQVVRLQDVPQFDFAGREGEGQVDVLVVDDEQIIADTLAMILSKSGYRAKVAYEGGSALEMARQYRPALVITDVVMPRMSGIELALALEALIPECKILLFSGQAATVDLLVRAREMGHDFAILNKPIHPADMLRRVSEYVKPVEQDNFATVN